MTFNIDQVAELYRPDEPYVVLPDATYTNYEGLKIKYEVDDEIPTQTQLDAVDYTNINSIDLWDRYGESVGKDFISVRAKIFGLVVAVGGFANLSINEKQLAAEYFVVGHADRLSVFGSQEAMEEAGSEFHSKALTARHKRYERSLVHIYNLVTQPDANAIATDFFSYGVGTLYIQAGVRGTLWGDTELEGLLDYINATVGTNFEPNGLRVNEAIPVTGTMDDVANDVIAIIMKDLV